MSVLLHGEDVSSTGSIMPLSTSLEFGAALALAGLLLLAPGKCLLRLAVAAGQASGVASAGFYETWSHSSFE